MEEMMGSAYNAKKYRPAIIKKTFCKLSLQNVFLFSAQNSAMLILRRLMPHKEAQATKYS